MSTRREKKTLLLVDDDYQLRLLLTMVLGNIGYEVVVAEDGFSALRKLRVTTPSVILSDLNMPGMSGFEFLSVVRRRFCGVRVIAMSGAFDGNAVPSGVAADAFYRKGNDLDELLVLLEPREKTRSFLEQAHTPSAPPIWISRHERDADGRAYLTINCPECLRSFRHFPDDGTCSLQQTACVHCYVRISFAVVENQQPAYLNYQHADRLIVGSVR